MVFNCGTIISVIFSQFIFKEDLATYGVDWEGPVPSEEHESVDVPEIELQNKEEMLILLNERVNPLAESNIYGIDLYMTVRMLVCTYTES